MSEWQVLMILILVLTFGYFAGGWSTWDLIKRYKKAQGYNPDPFDGKPFTSMEKFVNDNEEKIKEIE